MSSQLSTLRTPLSITNQRSGKEADHRPPSLPLKFKQPTNQSNWSPSRASPIINCHLHLSSNEGKRRVSARVTWCQCQWIFSSGRSMSNHLITHWTIRTKCFKVRSHRHLRTRQGLNRSNKSEMRARPTFYHKMIRSERSSTPHNSSSSKMLLPSNSHCR